MSGHPRQDGSWTFYVVQSLYNNSPTNKWGVYTWVDYLDTKELIESMGLDYQDTTLQASGNLWQQSGIHGTTSLEYAKVLLRLCRREEPGHAHRIAEMTVSRLTTPLEF